MFILHLQKNHLSKCLKIKLDSFGCLTRISKWSHLLETVKLTKISQTLIPALF